MSYVALAFGALIAAAQPSGSDGAMSEETSLRIPEGSPPTLFAGQRSTEVLLVQVLLDRARHSPGTIDGIMGANTRRAIAAYQRQHALPGGGGIGSSLVRRLRDGQSGDVFSYYTITTADLDRPFADVPSGMEEQAELEKVGYERPSEALAEKFHMAETFLIALNPGADFGKAGTRINVVAAGSDQLPSKVARIEVVKGHGAVRAFASDGQLVATYPATIGSSEFPSPHGRMEVRALAPNPKYYFDPSGRSWGPDRKLVIAAGPNNPVGSTWIDLSKEGYGIHGTPEPRLIGKTASHGCVRMTNWDAAELGQAVEQGTVVEFI